MNIDLTNISYSYPLPAGGSRPALKRVDLTIREGSCLGVIGPEGAGKTTLLLLLDMLLQPDEGTLSMDGQSVGVCSPLAPGLRKKIGLEFQFPEQQFVSESVRQEMLFGLDSVPGRITSRMEEALSAVGMEPMETLDRSPSRLSMGEARRVALATLLVRDPELFLFDEPTAGLDGWGREDFMKALMSLGAARKTMVIVSHDLDFLAEVATDIAVLQDGRLARVGDVGSVCSDIGILEAAGYNRPELAVVLETLAQEGKIPRGTFIRSREIGRLLKKESPGMERDRN